MAFINSHSHISYFTFRVSYFALKKTHTLSSSLPMYVPLKKLPLFCFLTHAYFNTLNECDKNKKNKDKLYLNKLNPPKRTFYSKKTKKKPKTKRKTKKNEKQKKIKKQKFENTLSNCSGFNASRNKTPSVQYFILVCSDVQSSNRIE